MQGHEFREDLSPKTHFVSSEQKGKETRLQRQCQQIIPYEGDSGGRSKMMLLLTRNLTVSNKLSDKQEYLVWKNIEGRPHRKSQTTVMRLAYSCVVGCQIMKVNHNTKSTKGKKKQTFRNE